MRVLIVNTYYSGGGAERVARHLYESLPKYGIETFFFAGRYQDDIPQDVIVAYKSFWERLLSFLKGFLMRNQLIQSHAATKSIINKIIEYKIDVVHFHNIHSYFLGAKDIIKIKEVCPHIIFTMHDMWMLTGGCAHSVECQNWKTNGCRKCYGNATFKPFWLAGFFEQQKSLVRKSEIRWIVPSEWLYRECIDSNIPQDSIRIIRNGLSTECFRLRDSNSLKIKYGIDKSKHILMFVASSINNVFKGYKYIEEALNLLKNKEEFAAIIVGTNEVNLPIKAYCYGYVKSDEKLSELYAIADIFLLPSIADNLPYTPMESMACGTPVIAFNTGGIPEIVGDDTGWVLQEKTSQAIANCIEYVFDSKNQDDLYSKSQKCSERVREMFDDKKMLNAYIGEYTNLVCQ